MVDLPVASAPPLLLLVPPALPLAEAAQAVVEAWQGSFDPGAPARPPACLLVPEEQHARLGELLRPRVRTLPPVAGVEDPTSCLRAALDQGATLVAGGTGNPAAGWRPGLLVNLPATAPLLARLPAARTLLLVLRRGDGDANLPAWVPRPHLLCRLGEGPEGP